LRRPNMCWQMANKSTISEKLSNLQKSFFFSFSLYFIFVNLPSTRSFPSIKSSQWLWKLKQKFFYKLLHKEMRIWNTSSFSKASEKNFHERVQFPHYLLSFKEINFSPSTFLLQGNRILNHQNSRVLSEMRGSFTVKLTDSLRF